MWPSRPALERFCEKYQVDENGCWVWTGAQTTRRGDPYAYGSFHYEGRMQRAHRISYQLFVGPIPDGLTIDHLCRNRLCVNPRHLEPVTFNENMARGKPIHITHCPQGHPYSAENTYTYGNRRNCIQCRNDRKRERRAATKAASWLKF